MEQKSQKTGDAYTLKYALWAAIGLLPVVLAHDLDRIFNLYFLLPGVVIFSLGMTALLLVVCLIQQITLRNWKRATSVLMAPLIAAGSFFSLSAVGLNTDRIRFLLSKPYYLHQIALLPKAEGKPRVMMFNWGETGGAGVVNITETLIYDEADQIARPASQRSQAWREHACPRIACDLSDDIPIIDFGDHFYFVREVSG